MKYFPAALALFLLCGCRTPIPPGAERGPDGTMAYFVPVLCSHDGARVEVNEEYAGTTPMTLKIWGDPDGTFHNFGRPEYTITVQPVKDGEFAQTKSFHTGQFLGPKNERIPRALYFDLDETPLLQEFFELLGPNGPLRVEPSATNNAAPPR